MGHMWPTSDFALMLSIPRIWVQINAPHPRHAKKFCPPPKKKWHPGMGGGRGVKTEKFIGGSFCLPN